MIAPMNYRRGLQRLYAVLTVAWIALVLFTVLPGRWRPWLAFSQWQSELHPYTQGGTGSLEDIDLPATARLEIHTRRLWAVGLSIGPPLIAYLLLFYVAPWLYHGFRSGTHI